MQYCLTDCLYLLLLCMDPPQSLPFIVVCHSSVACCCSQVHAVRCLQLPAVSHCRLLQLPAVAHFCLLLLDTACCCSVCCYSVCCCSLQFAVACSQLPAVAYYSLLLFTVACMPAVAHCCLLLLDTACCCSLYIAVAHSCPLLPAVIIIALC